MIENPIFKNPIPKEITVSRETIPLQDESLQTFKVIKMPYLMGIYIYIYKFPQKEAMVSLEKPLAEVHTRSKERLSLTC